MELPHIAGHALKVLNTIDADALNRVDVGNLLNHVASLLGKGGYQLVELAGLHQMERHQFRALFCEGGKKVTVAGDREAGKIALQKLGVAFPIRRGVKHRVHVVEYVLRTESRL